VTLTAEHLFLLAACDPIADSQASTHDTDRRNPVPSRKTLILILACIRACRSEPEHPDCQGQEAPGTTE